MTRIAPLLLVLSVACKPKAYEPPDRTTCTRNELRVSQIGGNGQNTTTTTYEGGFWVTIEIANRPSGYTEDRSATRDANGCMTSADSERVVTNGTDEISIVTAFTADCDANGYPTSSTTVTTGFYNGTEGPTSTTTTAFTNGYDDAGRITSIITDSETDGNAAPTQSVEYTYNDDDNVTEETLTVDGDVTTTTTTWLNAFFFGERTTSLPDGGELVATITLDDFERPILETSDFVAASGAEVRSETTRTWHEKLHFEIATETSRTEIDENGDTQLDDVVSAGTYTYRSDELPWPVRTGEFDGTAFVDGALTEVEVDGDADIRSTDEWTCP